MPLHKRQVVLVDKRRAKSRAQHAHRHGDEHQPRFAGRVPLALLVNDWKGHEEHVQEAVEDAHVQRDEKDDELLEEQLERADQENAQALRHGPQVQILLGDVGVVAGGGAELSGAAVEDRRCVRLGHGKGNEDPDHACKDELDPVEPPPAGGIREVTTDEGTD